jgi:hypothetical protein
MVNAFSEYLISGSQKDAAFQLIRKLKENSFDNEACAVELFFQNPPGKIISIDSNPWSEGKCNVGQHLPQSPGNLDVWFDVIELTPYVFIASRQTWYALHPVYSWQYRSFLNVAEFIVPDLKKLKQNEFMSKSATRISKLSDKDYARNIYHEEAMAYCKWFGKHLMGDYLESLKELKDQIPQDILEKICPDNINIWSSAEYPGDENIRMAFRIDMPDYEYTDELEGMVFPLEKKIFYDRFETSGFVGISTVIYHKDIQNYQPPFLAYDFITLNNVCPRFNKLIRSI